MFCVKCGKKSEINYLCEKCYMDGKDMLNVEDFPVDKCPKCENYRTKKYSHTLIENIIIEKFNLETPLIELKEMGGKINANIKSSIFIPELKKYSDFEKKIDIRIKARQCANCSMKSGNYHEAIIQVRGENKNNIIKKLTNALKSSEVTKIIERKEGYDIKLIKKSKAASIMKHVKNICDIKTSFKLVGEKNGRKLYRDTYSLR